MDAYSEFVSLQALIQASRKRSRTEDAPVLPMRDAQRPKLESLRGSTSSSSLYSLTSPGSDGDSEGGAINDCRSSQSPQDSISGATSVSSQTVESASMASGPVIRPSELIRMNTINSVKKSIGPSTSSMSLPQKSGDSATVTGKIKKKTPTKAEPVSDHVSPLTDEGRARTTPSDGFFEQPEWYKKLKKNPQRNKATASEDAKLQELKSSINQIGTSPQKHQIYTRLIESIHNAMFLSVNAQLVRDHQLLHPGGLQALFCKVPADTPYYLVADAEELWHKWANRIFDTDLMHGIKFQANEAASIKPGYEKKRSASVSGANNLVNGQWFPSQLCLVRDGAHGSSMGGIAGRMGEGAWSVVLSAGMSENGDRYPDHDNGEEVLYCGTDGKEGKISENTQRMIETFELGNPLRLIRSSTCAHSAYRPKEGFRYDGLYEVTKFDIIDKQKMRYRFTLVRTPGQPAIRHSGPGKRPTEQELKVWRQLHKNKRFIVAKP
ncbi:hypothetical protein ANO11243_011000 [Dothideomycetidae sp. 11243]|nr:hypothetical protein ANO11243_011000 [fungal sp. No.11243]